jgi:hypothetical protein
LNAAPVNPLQTRFVNRQGLTVRTETRADFEAHDPTAKPRGNETRFLCPFPLCAGHQDAPAHRSLSYNEQSGLWHCHRCDTRGQDPAKWKDKPPTATGFKSRRERERDAMARFFAVPGANARSVSPAPKSLDAVSVPVRATEGPETASGEAIPLWCSCIGTPRPLEGTAGAAYLEGRGLPADFCARAGVKFAPDYYSDKATGKPGRAAVVFPLRDANGRAVAAQGRLLDPDARLKALTTRGGTNGGLFATPGAFDGSLLVIVEAPLDALTLALCGLPAVATCGAGNFPERLKRHALGRVVLLAYDSDTAGDNAADKVTAALALAAPLAVHRLRPEGAKDWNELLQRDGRDALTAFLADFHKARVARFLPVSVDTGKDTAQPLNAPEKATEGQETGKHSSREECLGSVGYFDAELLQAGREADAALLEVETGEALPNPVCNTFPLWLAPLVEAERAGRLPNLREPFALPSGAVARDIGAAIQNGVILWRGAVAQSERNAAPTTGYCPRRCKVLALPWQEIAEREEADLRALARQFGMN